MSKLTLIVAVAIAALSACSSSSASSTSSFNVDYPYGDHATCSLFAAGGAPVQVAGWSRGNGYHDRNGPANPQLQALAYKWLTDADASASYPNATTAKDADAIAAWCTANGYPATVPSGGSSWVYPPSSG
jgi:hypothetical protein